MTVTVTGREQKESWRRGVLPPVERVLPGVWSLPVPIPDNPLRYVLVYAFEQNDGVVLIDAGWDAPEAWTALKDGLGQLKASIDDVRGVLVTHAHHDHYGLAARLQEASGAWLAMHAEEAKHLPGRDLPTSRDVMVKHWIRLGASSEDAESLVGGLVEWSRYPALPAPDHLLQGEERVLKGRDLRAIWTPGHTPGHLCFLLPEEKVLFSGDHVLPRISPNISLPRAAATHPLREFLRSLEAVKSLDVDEVMPGHEYRFSGLATRAADLQKHHEQRMDEVLSHLRGTPGSSTWHVAASITWSRTWDEMPTRLRTFAVGEVHAHLQLLEERGLVRDRGADMHAWFSIC